MIFQKHNTFSKSGYIVLGILSVFVLLIAGCTPYSVIKDKTKEATKKVTRSLTFSDKGLKKKIGIAIFDNKTSFKDKGFDEILQAHFIETLRESCPGILVLKPGDEGYPDIFVTLPRSPSGRVKNLSLIETGRQLGLNAIVTGRLIDIREDEKEKGLLWFKDSHRFIRVQATTEVYDTETGAKLIDESFMDEIEVETMDAELLESRQEVNVTVVKDAIGHIAFDMGQNICDEIGKQSWRGYIVVTSGDTVILSSGERVGLKPGDNLDVHDSGKIIDGAGDEQFFIPGIKIDEVKITAVYPDSAEAVSISGKPIKAGSTIRLKE